MVPDNCACFTFCEDGGNISKPYTTMRMLVRYLLLSGNNIHRQDGQHRAVHRHRNGDLIEGDAIEEDLHVFHAVHSHTRHADVARNARVIRIVSGG